MLSKNKIDVFFWPKNKLLKNFFVRIIKCRRLVLAAKLSVKGFFYLKST